MPVELDAEHVVGLALAPVRAFPDRRQRGDVRVELGAGGPQHDRDLRSGAADECHGPQLRARVDARVDGVQVATSTRVVAHERGYLHQSFAIHVEHEHVVQSRDARLFAETRRDVRPQPGEIGRGPRRAQYQFKASFLHA